MKKLIFILLLALLPMVLSAQRVFRYDSIPFPSGTDTTKYILMYDNYNWGLEVNYKALDNTDGTLDLGSCDVVDGTIFNRLDDIRLPYTLADTTVAFEKSNYSFKILAIKFTVESNTEGTIFLRLTRR